jgi:hypothetical protein
MLIDEVYQLVNFISDKEGRGYIKPIRFNVMARIAQLEFVDSRLPGAKSATINNRTGEVNAAAFGFKSNRRLDMDLRPFIYGPETISINNQGNFYYPYGFMFPDAIHKTDFAPITEIDSDQYPHIKRNTIHPPTSDYPVLIWRNPYGFIDPYGIGSFMMSYVKYPPNPVWAYNNVNDVEVFDAWASTDFTVGRINILEIAALILEKVGINLDKEQLVAYSQMKQG